MRETQVEKKREKRKEKAGTGDRGREDTVSTDRTVGLSNSCEGKKANVRSIKRDEYHFEKKRITPG